MSIVLIIIGIYLLLTFGVAWFFSRKESLEEYFINKRHTSLWMMTFSTVATVVGAGAVVAVVAEVYHSGISYGMFLPVSFIAGMLLLWFVAKKLYLFGKKHHSTTIVDFFEKRFDKKNKILVLIIQLFLLIIWIAVQAIAFASLASVILGIDYYIAILLSAAITILYTSMGGLKIDIITDFVQFWIFFIVFIILSFMGYQYIGGVGSLVDNLPPGHLNPFAFGGIGFFVFGILVSGFLYLGNTAHWQRIFSAKDHKVATKSFLIAIPIMIIIAVMVVFFGLIAAVILPVVPKETALFVMMQHILPPWILGIGIAAILAVIMSSVDSLIVGGSTIIHNLFRKKSIGFARLLTLLFGILGFLVAFLLPDIISLSLFVSYFALIFVPPILAGLYTKNTSANASFYALLIPSIILVSTYSIIGVNTFMITTPLGILIILFYDKIFKQKSTLMTRKLIR